MVRKHLQREVSSLRVEKGGSVALKNDEVVLGRIAKESPEAYYEWTLNGVFLKYEDDHVSFRGDGIFIDNACLEDAGVYVCMVYRINKQRLVIRVISLVVTTDSYTISTRATLPLTLKSNSVTLAYIYTDLSQKWLLNKKVYVDYGITTLAAVSSITLDVLNSSHEGVWECVVEQEDLKLSWTTNFEKVEVKSKPTFYTHLMEDPLTAPIFGRLQTKANVVAVLVLIVVSVVVVVTIVLVLYLKYGTLPSFRSKYKRNRRL